MIKMILARPARAATMMNLRVICFLGLVSLVQSVAAEVSVVDRLSSSQKATQQSSSQSKQSAELYYKLQLMEQEVLQLRGLLEQQAHEVKKLKQQHLEDYMELDRRLSQSSKSSRIKPSSSSLSLPKADKPIKDTVVPLAPEGNPEDELKEYRQAIDLVLKQKNFEEAKVSLQRHLSDYPGGRYSANAHYWLGEIALEQEDNNEAEKWFSDLLKKFPDHSKSDDARYKLGQVYFENGDKARAKSIMDELSVTDKSVAELAKRFLDKNFPEY